MRVLESTVETRFARAMRDRGIPCLKLNVQGSRGWPDRLVTLPNGRVIFIEFKRPGGGRLSEHQKIIRELLEKLGHTVLVEDNADHAETIVMDLIKDSDYPWSRRA